MTAMTPIAAAFAQTDSLMPIVLSDLSPENAVRRSRGGTGPSVVWTLGHMLDYRYRAMNLFGADKQSPFAEKFGMVAATDGSDYPSLEQMQADWNRVQAELETVLADADDTALERMAPGLGPHGEQRVFDSLVFIAFHEAYHFGALGAVRKDIGLPGPAELVMAAMAAKE